MTDICHQDNLPGKKFSAVIMAGGTGGHIFPGLAVAKELQNRSWDVSWLGSAGGMEVELIGNTDIPLSLISIAGLRRNGLLGWIKAPFTLIKAMFQALSIMRKINPDIVIGFGGFASGPGGIASVLSRRPLLIHEQNAVAGLTNKILARFASKVFQAFPMAFNKVRSVETVGNPIRSEIINLNKTKKIKSVVNILIVGGSRGARVFNEVLPVILSPLILNKKISVRHQCGKNNSKSTDENYRKNKIDQKHELKVEEFIENMEQAYLWADLVICRAGALTVSEVAAVGISAIFVPYPYAVDDHQTKNALWLAEKGAAMLIDESKLKSESSRNEITALVEEPERIVEMGAQAKKIAYLKATEIMVSTCEALVEKAA